jgi:isopenicillin-N N-acyltransferase-like protein
MFREYNQAERKDIMSEILKFEGSPHDLGFQHGKQLSRVINHTIVPFVDKDMKEKGISSQQIQKIVTKYQEIIQDSFPEVVMETRGLAEGAGIHFEKAMLILLLWEVRDTVSHSFPECSSFVACGDATVDGSPIATQNTDWPKHMQEKNIGYTFHFKPKGKYSFIGRGLAGNLGRSSVIGFNEKGLCFVGSGVRQMQGAGFGFPPLISTRLGLENCATVDEFLDLLRGIPRWSHAGENVDVVDMEGNVARVSYTTKRIMTVQTKDHFMVSTNHFPNMEIRHYGPRDKNAYPSSYARYERIVELLEMNCGEVDVEKAKRIMSDHKYGNEPPEGAKSVCRHGIDVTTLTNIVMLPKKREFWMSEGNPCKGKYSRFNL